MRYAPKKKKSLRDVMMRKGTTKPSGFATPMAGSKQDVMTTAMTGLAKQMKKRKMK